MKHIIIECTHVKTVDEFWQEYVLVMKKQDGIQYFGKNLDALWDSLDAGGPGYPGPSEIFINGLYGCDLIELRNGLIKISHSLTNKDIKLYIT